MAQLRQRYEKEREKPRVACSECQFESIRGYIELHHYECSQNPAYPGRARKWDVFPLAEPCHSTRYCAIAHHCYRCRPGHDAQTCEECAPLFPF